MSFIDLGGPGEFFFRYLPIEKTLNEKNFNHRMRSNELYIS